MVFEMETYRHMLYPTTVLYTRIHDIFISNIYANSLCKVPSSKSITENPILNPKKHQHFSRMKEMEIL